MKLAVSNLPPFGIKHFFLKKFFNLKELTITVLNELQLRTFKLVICNMAFDFTKNIEIFLRYLNFLIC